MDDLVVWIAGLNKCYYYNDTTDLEERTPTYFPLEDLIESSMGAFHTRKGISTRG